MAVVALADDGVGDGVADARADAAGAFVVVAGVLVEEDGQDGVAEEVSGEEGAVGGGVALGVAVGALLPVVDVGGLLDAGDDSGEDEVTGSTMVRRARRELLLRSERDGVGDVDDVKVGDDAEDALLLLLLDLGFGDAAGRR